MPDIFSPLIVLSVCGCRFQSNWMLTLPARLLMDGLIAVMGLKMRRLNQSLADVTNMRDELDRYAGLAPRQRDGGTQTWAPPKEWSAVGRQGAGLASSCFMRGNAPEHIPHLTAPVPRLASLLLMQERGGGGADGAAAVRGGDSA